jgi:hypothetical protein
MTSSSNPHVRHERAITLQLLRGDRPARWTRADLQREVGVDQVVFLASLASLVIAGVAVLDHGSVVVASQCARHLDAIGLVVSV